MTWSIVEVWPTLKMKLSFYDRSDWVQFMIKTKEDSDVIDCIGLVYAKAETELSRPI